MITSVLRAYLLGILSVLVALSIFGQVPSAFAGPELKVTTILPQGKVERLARVVVRFSLPMRPLGDFSQPADKSPVKLSPRPAGQFRWLDTQTLAYILDRPLVGASRLKVTVPAGTRSLKGAALAKPRSVEITTLPIAPVEISPPVKRPLSPRPEIRLVLNQPVDLPSLASHAFFIAGSQRWPAKVTEPAPSPYEAASPHLARAYLIQSPRDIPPGQKVTLSIEPGVMPAQGDLPLAQAIRFTYQGYGPLSLVKWEMPDSPLGKKDPGAAFVLQFNNPVEAAAVWDHLTIIPPLPRPEELSAHASQWFAIDKGIKPRTTYQVRVSPGLTDDYGTKLSQEISVSFTTGDLPPFMELPPGAGVIEDGEQAVYPVRLMNLKAIRAGLRLYPPSQAVAALSAEENRPWNKKPKPPSTDEGDTKVLDIEPDVAPNQTALRPLLLKEIMGPEVIGGLLLVDLRSTWPDYQGKPTEQVRRALLQVTDLGLSLKVGVSSGAAWVTRLSNGEPLAGVSLELRDRENRVLWSGESGSEGLAKLPSLKELNPAPDEKRPWRDPVVYLLANHDGDFAILPVMWGDSLVYNLGGVPYQGPGQTSAWSAHGLFQLPLYQPGQKVRFVVYLRELAMQGFVVPKAGEVEAWIEDSQGRKVSQLKGQTSPMGSLAGHFALSEDARLGGYSLYVKPAGQGKLYAGGFQVASFVPPDFKVELDAPEQRLGPMPAPGAQAKVEAAYLFGSPVAQGQAVFQARQHRAYFAPPRLQGYAVGDLPLPDDEPRLDQDLERKEAKLDQDGRVSFPLPQAKPQPGLPVEISLTALVSDPSGRAQQGEAVTLVHPSALYLGLKTPLLAQAGQKAEFSLAAASYDNKPITSGKVRLIAYKQFWETVREKAPGGFYRHLTKARREQVWQGEAHLGAEPAQASFTPAEAGAYVLMAEAEDDQGRITRSASYLWVSGQGLAGWQRFDDHRLELNPDKETYLPGENARVLVKNPFKQAIALVSVERLGIRRIFVQPVEGPAPVVEVPLGSADAPGVYVGVLLVRGRNATPNGQGPDLGRPQVRLGYATIKVEAPKKKLEVSLTPDTTHTRPGEIVKVEVKVKRAGMPVAAEITLLAVDERILVAAGGVSYDPSATFDQLSPLAVLTADMRTQVMGRFQAEGKGGEPGGGGGMGPGLRRDFHPAVFWLAQVQTFDDGKLSTSFRLPDTLSAYRVVAVAADTLGAFGVAQTTIRASLPLQVLSALPRFAVVGDKFKARVLVQNLSDKKGAAMVQAKSVGLFITGGNMEIFDLAPGETKAIGFEVLAKDMGVGQLAVRAKLGDHADGALFTLPIIPAASLITSASAGTLPAGPQGEKTSIPLLLPAGAQPGRGGLSLDMAPSLASYLARPTRALLDYPWDCLEQKLSRNAARAFRISQGERFGLPPDGDDPKALAKLGADIWDFATPTGGLAYWPGLDRPDAFLTAYTLLAARRMAPAGFDLSLDLRKKAIDYLERNLKKTPAPKANDLYGRLSEALSVLVLAMEGQPAKPAFEAALSRAQGLTPFGLACLLETAGIYKMPQAVDRIIKLLEVSAEVSAAGLSFSAINPGGLKAVMGSQLRGNALVLEALAKFKPDYPRLDALARWVAQGLGDKPQLSTQDAVFGLWGLSAYLDMAAGSPDLEAMASLAGRELGRRKFTAQDAKPLALAVARDDLAPGKKQDLELSATGQGRLFYAVRLAYAPAKPSAEPVSAGFSLARYFQAAPGNDAAGPPWALGSEVEMSLVVICPDLRRHVVVKAPFPAGLEPVGAAKGAPQVDDAAGPSPWQWQELRENALMLYAPSLRPGVHTYTLRLRAVAPGDFNLRPARAEEMYAPEVFGLTGAGLLQVK